MSGWNCDIVRDLVPSYLDDVCSDSTRQVVEEHTAECGECRDYLRMLEETRLVSDRAEQGELDYMKKVRGHFRQRNKALAGCCALALCDAAVLWLVLMGRHFLLGGLLGDFFCTVFVPYLVLTAVLAWMFAEHREKPRLTGWRTVTGILGAAGILYSVGIVEYFVRCAYDGRSVWGLEPQEMGPVLTGHLAAVALAELCMTLLTVVRSAREEQRLGLLPVVTLMGHFLSIALFITLASMANYEAYLGTLHRLLGSMAAEGIALGVFSTVIRRSSK